MSESLRELIPGFMLYVLLPLWFVAGVADYLLHRRTRIEHTSGVGESRLHVLQAIEIAIPLLAGLFLEINSLVLGIMILFVLAHTATALWDAAYSTPRRYISPLEQHVHSHLEYVPLIAVALVVLMHWEGFLGLLSLPGGTADFGIRLKRAPLSGAVILAVLVPVFLVQGTLLAEEAIRTGRAARSPRTNIG
jgi:hypothetical protein